jgi:hypothetical protein
MCFNTWIIPIARNFTYFPTVNHCFDSKIDLYIYLYQFETVNCWKICEHSCNWYYSCIKTHLGETYDANTPPESLKYHSNIKCTRFYSKLKMVNCWITVGIVITLCIILNRRTYIQVVKNTHAVQVITAWRSGLRRCSICQSFIQAVLLQWFESRFESQACQFVRY